MENIEQAQLELEKAKLEHSVEMYQLNRQQFEHRAKLEKLQALFTAREFANTIKNYTWGESLQKQIEQLTQEIYPISKLTL